MMAAYAQKWHGDKMSKNFHAVESVGSMLDSIIITSIIMHVHC